MGYDEPDAAALELKSIEWSVMKWTMHKAGLQEQQLKEMGMTRKLLRHFKKDEFGFFTRESIRSMTATTIWWSWRMKHERANTSIR